MVTSQRMTSFLIKTFHRHLDRHRQHQIQRHRHQKNAIIVVANELFHAHMFVQFKTRILF